MWIVNNSQITRVIGEDVIDMLLTEAEAAHVKHGKGSILNGEREPGFILACAMEELGEVAKEIMEGGSVENQISEWIQVANVAVSAVEVMLRDNRGRS